ncbi:MAG TPA: hypothetical protein PKA90_08720, partial [Ignavibacteria bacterium]|nr:hypothetical protein [Ignavibacteria bacterium]
MSDRVNKNPSIEELLSLINTLIKENEFLKFENDTLIKQNKLHIAFFDKQLLRIENMNRFNELMTVINQKFSGYIKYSDSYNKKSPDNLINADSFNNSDLSENEKNEPRNEKNEPRNEKNEPRNEKNELRNEK